MNRNFIYSFVNSNHLLKKNNKFKLYSNISRPVLLCWQGSLPISKKYLYILFLIKLTGWVPSNIDRKLLNSINKSKPDMTHDISCVYYNRVSQSTLFNTLFSFQVQANDMISEQLSDYLAKVMLNCPSSDSRFLLNRHYKKFWHDLSIIKFSDLVRSEIKDNLTKNTLGYFTDANITNSFSIYIK